MASLGKVGFLGLGRMGAAMAANLVGAGYDVAVWNRSPGKTGPLVALGARAADSPRAAATGAEAVFTSLMDDASVRAVLEGEDGLLAGLARGAVHVGTTTSSPPLATELARRHAERGQHYVAAPVLGRPDAAAQRRLIGIVGGEHAVVERVRPFLEALTASILDVGEDHAVASSTKLAMNCTLVTVIDLVGEIYAFAEKSGIASEVIARFFETVLPHPGLQGYAKRIRAREFDDPGFALTGGLKDAQLMVDAARAVGAPLRHAEIVREKLAEAVEHGLGGKDLAAVAEVSRRRAGLA